MSRVVENLAVLISPVLCHMAEDIWQNIPYSTKEKSVFQRGWPTYSKSWKNESLNITFFLKSNPLSSSNTFGKDSFSFLAGIIKVRSLI